MDTWTVTTKLRGEAPEISSPAATDWARIVAFDPAVIAAVADLLAVGRTLQVSEGTPTTPSGD